MKRAIAFSTPGGSRVLLAGLVATLLLPAADSVLMLLRGHGANLSMGGQAYALLTLWTLHYLVPTEIYALLLAGIEALAAQRPESDRSRRIAHVLLAAAVASYAHHTLARYTAFAEELLLIIPYVLAGAALAAFAWVLGIEPEGFGRWTCRMLTWGPAFSALVLSVGSYAANRLIYPDRYPTLHLSVLQLTHAFAIIGLAHAFSNLSVFFPTRRRRRIALWATGLFLLLGPAALAATGRANAGRSRALHFTLLGQVGIVFDSPDVSRETTAVRLLIDPQGEKRFLEHAHLPVLPDGFRLNDYSILLINVEAFRFDKTSLFDSSLPTTPNLVKLAADATVFTNAHAPSTTTLPSTVGLHSMTFPSATHLQSWEKSWCGELLPAETTVAELLSAAGWRTFWVGHDHHWGFSNNMLGLDQGFESRQLYAEPTAADGLVMDQRIADRALEKIAKLARGSQRFFGWVFFGSPHSKYLKRYADMPSDTAEELYLHEVRFVDEQIARLFTGLESNGLLKRTIVILAGDHGEEFGEHGGSGHLTLYGECTHVVFMVWVPGVKGGVVEATTSTGYVFPWLLLHGDASLRDAALWRLTHELGPAIRATRGAVIAELVGYDKMSTAFIYEDKKYIYDYITSWCSAYDLVRDPGEREDLSESDPKAQAACNSIANEYSKVRSAVSKYTLAPNKHVRHGRPKRR
jgi:arylsulfatase A-like enzyme